MCDGIIKIEYVFYYYKTYGEYNILCFKVLWEIFQDMQYYLCDRH
jgi:hypothetical protein